MRNNMKYVISSIFFLLVFVLLINTNSFVAPKTNSVALNDTSFLFNSNRVSYSDSNSGIAGNTVQSAIEEIYQAIQDGCFVGYTKGTSTSTTYKCNKKSAPGSVTTDFDSNYVKYDNSGNGLTSTTVKAALGDLASHVAECKQYFHKENETSSGYDCVGDEYTATFYYQSNATSGSTTVTNVTASCNSTSTGTCTVTIPSEVRSSVGTYNNAYYGLSNTAGNMTAAVASGTTTVTLSGNKDYYTLYSSQVTIYYPSSTTATSNKKIYRNQWLSSKTAMANTVLASGATGTSTNATAGTAASGYSTLVGFSTSVSSNTADYAAITNLVASNATTVYQINSKQVTATFYYNQNATPTCNTTSIKTATAAGTQYLRCKSTSASEINNGTLTVPSAVSESKGPHNTTYVNVASETSSMTAATLNTGTTTYYAYYKTDVKIYYGSSATAASNKTVYRNEFFTSTSAMNVVLASSATGTSTNATAGTAASGYSTLVGFATSAGTNTPSNTAISDLASVCQTTFYQINKKTEDENATFYYSNSATGAKTSTTASGTKTTFLRPTSTTAAGTSVTHSSCTVPTSLTGEVAPTGTISIGWATSASTMSASSSPTCTAGNSYYKVYRNAVTIYKPTSASACNSTSTLFYRNAYYGTDTNYTVVLATTNTGTSDNASYTSGVTGYTLSGFATASSSNTITYNDLAALKASATITAYAVLGKEVTVTFYYNQNATATCNTTNIKTTTVTGTQNIRCKNSSTAEIYNESLAVPSAVSESKGPHNTAYVNVASGTSSMTAATVNTGTTTYYAYYKTDVKIYYPSSTTAASNKTVYRNEFFTSTSAMKVVLSSSANGTSTNATAGTAASGYSTLVGFATAVSTNTATYATIEELAAACDSTVYQVNSNPENINITFYYSNSNGGAKTNSSVSGTKTTYLRCTSTTAAATNVVQQTITPPNTTVPYGTTLLGWSTSASSMSTTTVNTANTAYYAVYRKNVTNYYYNGSAYTSRTLYHNGVYGTNDNYTMYLSTTNTGTSNYSTAAGPGASVWTGLSTSADTTPEYTSVGTYNTGAAYSTSTSLYTVYQFNVTYAKGSNISAIGSTTGNCRVSATGASAGGTSCNVTLPTITANTGYTSVGWSTTNGATTGTAAGTTYSINTNPTPLYANAIANALTFNNQTLTSGTYGTNYNGTFTGASNGTGSYTYTIESGAPSADTSVDSSVRTLFLGIVPKGTYQIVIRATDDNSGATKTATMTVAIDAKPVPPTIASCNDKVYDGNTTATCTLGSVSGQLQGDVVSLTGGTCTFSDKNFGIDKTVTCTGISLTGANASNYSLSSTTATKTASITAKPLTITADNKSMNYSGTAPTYSYTVTTSDFVSGDSSSLITGTPSYVILNDNVETIDVTTANAGTYSINLSGLSAGNNYSITYSPGVLTINKVTCPAPTGVSIASSGAVSWTNVTGASSYQISMSSNSGFAAHTNGNVYNTITSATGTRTVYVRSVCSTTNYTSANSANATGSTTVYSVTLTDGTGGLGISALSINGTTTTTKNFITGSTVTLGATVNSNYMWKNWTQTSDSSQVVSTTQAYSGTITSNWNYTANAVDIWAENLEFDDTGTDLDCDEIQCALDNLKEKIDTENQVTQCNAPTNISINSAGEVTWTPSSNCQAAQHQVKIGNGAYTNEISGVNKHNDITAESGIIEVYVRALAPDAYYTNSTAASESVTVYQLTVVAGSGIDSIEVDGVESTSLNLISGETVELEAMVNAGYDWVNWTDTTFIQSPTIASTSNPDSFTITSNTIYTANATGKQYTIRYYNGRGQSAIASDKLGESTCTFGSPCTLRAYASDLGGVFPYSQEANTATGQDWLRWFYEGWTTQTGNTKLYDDGESINPTTYENPLDLYSLGRKPWRFSAGVAPTVYTTVNQYWNPRSSAEEYRTTITIPDPVDVAETAVNSTWTFLGYINGSNAVGNADVTFAASTVGTTVNPDIETGGTGWLRSKYTRTLTITYQPNGGSGTMTNSTLVQRYNSGIGTDSGTNSGATIGGNSITLKSNSFTYSGHTFSKWASGSTSGNQFAAGATFTGLGPNVTNAVITHPMYAIWTTSSGTLTGSVTITGEAYYSKQLSASVTNPLGASLSYQWYYNTSNSYNTGTAISGATGSTYQIPANMTCKYIWVQVTASKSGYTSVTWKDIIDASNNTYTPVPAACVNNSYYHSGDWCYWGQETVNQAACTSEFNGFWVDSRCYRGRVADTCHS